MALFGLTPSGQCLRSRALRRPYLITIRLSSPPVEVYNVALSRRQDSYLVDSASSHMLVSKIKPCMSKYKQSIL